MDLESQGAFDYLDAPSPVPSITGAVGGFDQDFIDTLQGPLFDQIGTLTDQVSRLEEQLSTSQDSGISNQILLQLLGGFGQREEEERGPFSGGAFYPTGNPFLAT